MATSSTPSRPQVPPRPSTEGKDPRREHGALESEWVETNGRGGFASSTRTGTPARRYHGLLFAPFSKAARRHLFLAGVLDRWSTEAGTATLTRLRHAGAATPPAPDGLASWAAVPWPTARFELGGHVLTREILMPRGRAAVLIRYGLEEAAGISAELDLEPLLAFREADTLTFRNDVLRVRMDLLERGVRARPYETLPAMSLLVDGGRDLPWEFEAAPRWHAGVEYATDLARGYGGHEDLFSPGRFVLTLRAGETVTLAASIDDEILDAGALFTAEAERRTGGEAVEAADAFLYRDREDRVGVLAGFPWFGEWGRDTFIALPGLTLARGDLATCAEALRGALPFLKDGLLPNIFGRDTGDSHYGSVDASLWFARAVLLYQRAGGDEDLVLGELAQALEEIADAYQDGTAPGVRALGIRTDAEMLLHVGTPDLNPTWMDARTSRGPVTPRHGSPVEIAALWCSLLRQVDQSEAAARAERAFLDRFWLPEEGYLADVWSPDGVDVSVRPNMVLAASLELSPLDPGQRRRILARADAELLTPYGLRTLSPSHPAYRARYRGGPDERDGAYHQGTVWPWLLGFYCEASLRVDDGAVNRDRLRALWRPLEEELEHGGLGHLSEVYDGDPPHRRGGTFAQAWNTAEALRARALLDGSLSLGDHVTS